MQVSLGNYGFIIKILSTIIYFPNIQVIGRVIQTIILNSIKQMWLFKKKKLIVVILTVFIQTTYNFIPYNVNLFFKVITISTNIQS